MTRYCLKSSDIIITDDCSLSVLKDFEKNIQREHDAYKRVENSIAQAFINEMIENAKYDLKLIQKLQRKANGYKNIIITKEGDYDSYTTIIDFPKGTRKDFKHQWLIKNNYPTESEHYNINSMYDCTGQVHSVYVTYDKNKVIITSYRDL